MTQTQARRLFRTTVAPRTVVCSVLAGLAIGLAGCEENRNDYAQQLEEARNQMMVLSATGENRASEIEQVIAKLNNAMRGVEGEAKGPAQLMIASATADLAEIKMGQARTLASEISLDLVRAASHAQEYSKNRAFASTLVGPDAGKASGAIETEIRTVDAELRDLQNQRQELVADLAEVNTQIDQLMASARTERLAEADLRDQAIDAEPMRRSELIGQAAERSRAAEAAEKAAAERELTVNSLEVAIAQVDQIIESQQAIRAIHTQGLERISRIDSEIDQRRGERETVTSESLGSFRNQLDAVLAKYRGQFTEVAQAAAEGYTTAASTARQARSMGSLATTAAGEHAADAARAHEMRAQTARRIASSASYMVDINAEGRAYYQGIQSEFEGIASDAEALAAESFSEAASALASADERLSENYEARARALRGEPDPVPVQDDPADMGGDEAGTDDPMNSGG